MLLFPLYLYLLFNSPFYGKILETVGPYNISIWSNYNIFKNNFLVVSSVFMIMLYT